MTPETTEIRDLLIRNGIIDPVAPAHLQPLSGGVSSDIWRVDQGDRTLCVKRALAKLKVAQDWRAPVSRNAFEAAWMQTVRGIDPTAAPEVILHVPEDGLFVMPFLAPSTHPLWKDMLRDGNARETDAAAVGARLGRIHAATTHDPDIAARFASDDIFHAIRLEPYLLATAKRHPTLAPRLHDLAEITAGNRHCLVHGDVSPKNILIGPDGPIFIDAECAWYGDPAFDVAFCLNHLLLKCLWTPSARPRFRTCFAALTDAYAAASIDVGGTETLARTAHLLPGLFLARIDGKSPVEYVTDPAQKDLVRETATELLTTPPCHPIEVADIWHANLSKKG